MKKTIFIALLCLSACNEIKYAFDDMGYAKQQCTDMGFLPGSIEHAQCTQNQLHFLAIEDHKRRQREAIEEAKEERLDEAESACRMKGLYVTQPEFDTCVQKQLLLDIQSEAATKLFQDY